MKRSEFFQLVQPLSDKLYRFAYSLIPDDLQAEQLVIDGLNAFLIKEKKLVLNKDVNLSSKKDLQVQRKFFFKHIIFYVCDIGVRRSLHMSKVATDGQQEFEAFYKLDAKVRAVLSLRYDHQLTVEEIESVLLMPRYEVIEKLHNGRFLLLNKLTLGAEL